MTLKHLSNLSVVTAEKAHQLTALTEKLLYTEVGSRVATEGDVDAIKYGLVNIRQFQIYQGLVSKEVSNCGNRLSTLDQDLLKHLTDLQTTIGTQLAVASSNVYPQFVRLALTWQGFQASFIYKDTKAIGKFFSQKFFYKLPSISFHQSFKNKA